MLGEISHLTFIVADLERATEFFQKIFQAKEVYRSDAKEYSKSAERFFLIGDLWVAIMVGNSLSEKTYNHIALKVKEKELPLYLERIESLGLEIETGRSRVTGEGASLYFYDFDNHLFELHTGTLNNRLKRYLGND